MTKKSENITIPPQPPTGETSGTGKFSNDGNWLGDLYQRLNVLAIAIRDNICQECGWSIPTFYRKIRQNNGIQDRISPPLSNAEKEKIMTIFQQKYTDELKFLEERK